MVYQAKNMSSPVLTHISHIGHGYFVCAHSRTERIIPVLQAQSVLTAKLTLIDIDREVHGGSLGLGAGERVIWRRWLEDEHSRIQGRMRVQVAGAGWGNRFLMCRCMLDNSLTLHALEDAPLPQETTNIFKSITIVTRACIMCFSCLCVRVRDRLECRM